MTVTDVKSIVDFENNNYGLPAELVIDRKVYFDETVFDQEMELIFKKTWQLAGHESELKNVGDFVAVDIANQRLLVTRGKDGELHAFYNTCTHRGAALTMQRKGNCRSAFRCMYHGWSFDLTGKLTGMARPAHHDGVDKSAFDIPAVQVDVHAGFVFINVDPDAMPLADFLGDGAQLLQDIAGGTEALGRVSFNVDGNWKLWSENFRDGYHPEYTHPLVGEYYKEVARSTGTISHNGLGHSKLWWPFEGNPRNIGMKMEALLGDLGAKFESPGTRPSPPADMDFSKGSTIVCIFPNLDVQNLMAGAEQCIQIARPITPSKTRVDLIVLGEIGEPENVRKFRMMKSLDAQASSGKVSGDDCEASLRITHAIQADPIRWTPLTRGAAGTREGQKTEDQAIRGFYSAWREYMSV
jgi:phenylpropionate dioxygenase-like ring-hydroxylating dioxygenase large terminal subunit